VNDLSTLSRSERGALQITIDAINPHQLVEELASGYHDQAAAKGLEVKTDLDPSLEILHSSNLYVREILHNFITNSIKYTQQGSVTIGAHAQPDGVRFSVSDTGIGMSHSDQQKIFNKFFRSEDYRTRASNGTGLGLYITRKLADLLHGEIIVTSELNHGSTFALSVPNLSAEQSKQEEAST
jgi:signal transduction histidine kinase